MENQNTGQGEPVQDSQTSVPAPIQTPTTSANQNPKSNHRTLRIFIIGVIIIAFLIISGSIAYFYKQNTNEPLPVMFVNENWTTSNSSNSEWTKYINSGKDFSLEVPNNWIFESYLDGAFIYSPDFKWGRRPLEDKRGVNGALIELIITDTNKKSLDEWGNSQENTGQNKEVIKIGNIDALKYTLEYVTYVDFIQNGKLLRATIYFYDTSKEENTKVFNQILSTFKFTQ